MGVLWLASFSAVYGLQAVTCAQGWGHLPVVLAWGQAIAAQAALLAGQFSRRFGMHDGAGRWASLALGVFGLVAVVWTLFPVVALEACL
jgi:hypothetical protein